MKSEVVLKIGDFLGFCDLNGVEALSTEQVQELEDYVAMCQAAAGQGEDLVPNAIYDRLIDLLVKANPDSSYVTKIWESLGGDDLDDSDDLVVKHPMFSIQTVKSYDCDELTAFIDRLPDDGSFDAHISIKLNGHGIRLKYKNGKFFQARTRARSSAGRDITAQLQPVLYNLGIDEIADLEGVDLCEIRGEWVLPLDMMETAKKYNPDIKSPFTGVSSMGRDSASEEEWSLLSFIAYEFVCEGFIFSSKAEEYEYIESLGFEIPPVWIIEDLKKESLCEDLPNIVADIEMAVDEMNFNYYSDGLVFAINDTNFFKSLGDDGGHYKYGNMALKVGRWKQDQYSGYVQCILWKRGKTKFSPVAILGREPGMLELEDFEERTYIYSTNEIANWKSLGVVTASGNTVRRVPLYEPNNMVVLDAYPGHILHFKYGGEAGVIPCFDDGTPLIDGRIQQTLGDDESGLTFFDESSFNEIYG